MSIIYPPAHAANPFQPPGAWRLICCGHSDVTYSGKDSVEDDDNEKDRRIPKKG